MAPQHTAAGVHPPRPALVAQGPSLHSVTQQAPGRTWKARALQCRQLAVVAVAVEVAVEVGAEAPQLVRGVVQLQQPVVVYSLV